MSLSIRNHEALLQAILRLHDYEEVDRVILDLLRPHYYEACRAVKKTQAPLTLRTYHLSRRETEVAKWLAEGKSNPEIAVILGAKPRTVEKHMERILEKLGAENRTVAALMMARLLPPNGPGSV